MRAFAAFAFALTLMVLAGCEIRSANDDDYTEDMAEEHAHDTPEATPIATEPHIPVDTSQVQYGTAAGQTLTGYMAVPSRPDSVAQTMGRAAGDTTLPAIIVIHEWWGLNDNIKAMTRRLAGEGYRALAVNMYGGEVAETSDQAQALMQQAMQDQGQLTANIEAAYRHLAETYGAENVGIIGWCFGGAQSLQGALALPDELDATVIYYGRLETAPARLQTLNMPVLGFFGGADQGIPVSGVRTFENTLDSLGKDAEIHVYEGAGHAFANPSGQNYVEDAARDSWDKTVAFFREHLYGS